MQAAGGGSRSASAPTAGNQFTRSPACGACPEWGRKGHKRRCPHYGSASVGLAQELIGSNSAKRVVQQCLRCRTPRNSQLNKTAGMTVAGQDCLSLGRDALARRTVCLELGCRAVAQRFGIATPPRAWYPAGSLRCSDPPGITDSNLNSESSNSQRIVALRPNDLEDPVHVELKALQRRPLIATDPQSQKSWSLFPRCSVRMILGTARQLRLQATTVHQLLLITSD